MSTRDDNRQRSTELNQCAGHQVQVQFYSFDYYSNLCTEIGTKLKQNEIIVGPKKVEGHTRSILNISGGLQQ